MKKILTLLAIALVGLASCKKEPTKVYSISIDPTELSFAAAGGEETVEVTSSAEWELSGESYWCYASSYSGKGNAEILFSADPNEDSESSRSATFTFISGDKKATLTVTQEKKEYSICIEPTELTFGADGGDQTITVTSSDSWEVKGESDWCDISATTGKNGDKVTFSAAQYTNTEEARTATYTFVCGDKEAELKIEQEAKVYSISVEPTTLTYDVEGGEQTVTITSSDEWTAAYPTDHKDWLKVSSVEGENGAKVNITVEKSDSPEIRYSCVSFYCGDKKADVTIEQAAKEYSISVEPTEITFNANGEEKEVTVSSSDEWELTTDCGWIQTSTSKGENGASIKITASFNNTSEQRTGTMIFTCGNKTAELHLTQEANDFSISIEPAEIEFGAEGGKQIIKVTSSHKWTLANDNDWITTSINDGESGSSVEISVGYSTSTETKSGEIIFTCGDKTVALKVSQEPDGSPVIQFKDPYFRAAILDQADINGDGQITEKEAASVKVLTTETNGNPSRNIDELKYFFNLEALTIASIDIETLDIDLNTFKNLNKFSIGEKDSYASDIKVSSLSAKGHEKLSSINIYKAIFSSDIDLRECENLTNISLRLFDANNVLLDNCTSLSNVDIYGNWDGRINIMSLYNCSSLKTFEVSGHRGGMGQTEFKIDEINLQNCTTLTEVSLGSHTEKLDLSGCSSLMDISASGYGDMTTLILNGCSAVEHLNCSDAENLTSLDISACTSLKYLSISYTGITQINLNNNPNITELFCDNTPLTTLDINNQKVLTTLWCYNCQLTSLNLSENAKLKKLRCGQNQLTSLDVSKSTALTELWCGDNQLTSLDVSKNTALTTLLCSGNPLSKLILYKYHILTDSCIKELEEEYGDIIEYVE